jgi:tetratricopeptide (TPR) repeat protein
MPREYRDKVIDIAEVTDKRRNTISCCIIARDEEETIGDAIRSVKDLADEVIVVDTGSSDRTIVYAKQEGARVHHASWNNDFSEARNLAMSKAAASWILVLDADEVLDAEAARRIRDIIEAKPGCAFVFEQRTYTIEREGDDAPRIGHSHPDDPPSRFISRQVRLFPNREGVQYRGPIHEGVEGSLEENGIETVDTDIPIHHHGREKGSQRVYRNLRVYLSVSGDGISVSAGDARYVYELAALLFEAKRFEDAATHASRGLELEPDNCEFMNILGLTNLLMRRLDAAEDWFRRAIGTSRYDSNLYNNLGVALVEQGRMREAIRCLETGIEFCGENSSMKRNLASACLELGLMDKALVNILDSIDLDPFVGISHVIHAEILFGMGDCVGASKALDRIRFLEGTSLKVFLRMIHLYTRMDMIDEAESVYYLAREAYPDHDGLIYLSGKISEMKGDDERALSIFQKLLASRPEDADLHNSIGCVYERLGRLEKALLSFGEAKRLDPENVQIEVNLGILKGRLGYTEDAEVHLRKAVCMDGGFGTALNALGCHLANQTMYDEAIECFERAVETEPENALFLLNLGMAREKVGMLDEALEAYERVAELDPGKLPENRTGRQPEPIP